ncbi:MAG: hypothetical protein OD918_04815 [Gammaproteobacteria bacterium]
MKNGAVGATGQTGAAGPSGTTGQPGQKGEVGISQTGAQGASGAKGDQGVPGAPGSGGGGGLEFTYEAVTTAYSSGGAGAGLNALAESLQNEAGDPPSPGVPILGDAHAGGGAHAAPNAPSAKQTPVANAVTRPSAKAAIRDVATVLRRAAVSPQGPAYRLVEVVGGGGSSDAVTGAVIAGLQDNWEDIQTLRGESREGSAIAIALGGLHIPPNKTNAISMRYGRFEDQSAIAAQAGFRLRDNLTFDLGVSHGFDYSQRGYSAGFVLSW